MGLVVTAYGLLVISGLAIASRRSRHQVYPGWLRPLHILTGLTVAILVLLLLAIGVVGTLGEYGHLGHSVHLFMGLGVVVLTLASVWSARQISLNRPWAQSLHIILNGSLGLMLLGVGWSGWTVVQKYLP
jgi:lysylphosphatidylglycerol synthetase-like protein (DUF2156 family)